MARWPGRKWRFPATTWRPSSGRWTNRRSRRAEMDKAERLLDLVALLLDAREPISFAELRDLFPEEYGGSRAGAERKLERDKAELLELGVPIEYVEPGALDERDLGGYRLDRKSFFLPGPGLVPEESAALYAAG